jgi:hypothetical protein
MITDVPCMTIDIPQILMVLRGQEFVRFSYDDMDEACPTIGQACMIRSATPDGTHPTRIKPACNVDHNGRFIARLETGDWVGCQWYIHFESGLEIAGFDIEIVDNDLGKLIPWLFTDIVDIENGM